MPGLSGSPKITAWSDALPIFHLTSLGGVKVMWLGSGTSAATAPVAAMTAHAAIAKPKRRIEASLFSDARRKRRPCAIGLRLFAQHGKAVFLEDGLRLGRGKISQKGAGFGLGVLGEGGGIEDGRVGV